jgi:hypothetical protein
VVFVGYEFYQYRTGTPDVPVAQGSSAPDVAAGDTPTTAPDASADTGSATAALPPPLPTARPVVPRGLSLKVTDTSWLRVTIDGTVVLEGTLPAGASKSFSGKVADVLIGNAAGVRIAVNGRPLGPLGGSGDVVEQRIVLSGK